MKWEQLQLELLADAIRVAAARGVSINDALGGKCASALMLHRVMDLREIAEMADKLGAIVRISIKGPRRRAHKQQKSDADFATT